MGVAQKFAQLLCNPLREATVLDVRAANLHFGNVERQFFPIGQAVAHMAGVYGLDNAISVSFISQMIKSSTEIIRPPLAGFGDLVLGYSGRFWIAL